MTATKARWNVAKIPLKAGKLPYCILIAVYCLLSFPSPFTSESYNRIDVPEVSRKGINTGVYRL